MKIGDILRTLIEEYDLTQKELANQLNIAPSTLGSYIQNTREPDFATLKLFADYFHVSPDFLLDYHTQNTMTHQEDDLLRIFRALTQEQKDICVEQCKVFLRVNRKEKQILKEQLSESTSQKNSNMG